MNYNPPSVSIITVNYNQLELSCALLDSIRRVNPPNCEVILVDNASKLNPKSHLQQHYPEVKVVVSPENLGFAGGNNLGIKESTGDYLFFINNDAELTEGCIETLIDLFSKRPNLGIVSPLICYYPSEETNFKDIIQFAGTTPVDNYTARNETIAEGDEYTQQFTAAYPSAYVHGAAMMMPRKVLLDVGMMSEDFFLYYEELDWCEQVRKAGYEIYVEPTALIYHKESVSVGKSSTLKTYYLNRNRILFMRRNRSFGQVFVFSLFLLFFTIPKNILVHLVKGEFAHIKAFVKAIWWNIAHPSAGKIIKNELQLKPSNTSKVKTKSNI